MAWRPEHLVNAGELDNTQSGWDALEKFETYHGTGERFCLLVGTTAAMVAFGNGGRFALAVATADRNQRHCMGECCALARLCVATDAFWS